MPPVLRAENRPMIQAITFDASGKHLVDPTPDQLSAALRDQDSSSMLWVDMQDATSAEADLLGRVFGFHSRGWM